MESAWLQQGEVPQLRRSSTQNQVPGARFDCAVLTRNTRIHEYTHQYTHSSALLRLCSWHLDRFLVSFITTDENFVVDTCYSRTPRTLKTKTSPKRAAPLCSVHFSLPFLHCWLSQDFPDSHYSRLEDLSRLLLPFSFPYWFHLRWNISTILPVKSGFKLPIQVWKSLLLSSGRL